jgi:carotene biosynthesis associated membrane protein
VTAWIPAGLPWCCGVLAVAAQIPYPLVHGQARDNLTIIGVSLFFAASLTHAAWSRGVRRAAVLAAVAAGVGLAVEAIGVGAGVPFGRYSYGTSLGGKLLGVPAVIPLAWAMMAYPALLAGRRASLPTTGRSGRRRAAVTAAVGGLVLATWDLFLDPQMVAAGQWAWRGGGPALNGIPLSNTGGWLAVGIVLTAVLDALDRPAEPRAGRDDRLPFVLLGWTYASSLLANLTFFGSPAVGLTGGLAMGAVLAVVVAAGHPRQVIPTAGAGR